MRARSPSTSSAVGLSTSGAGAPMAGVLVVSADVVIGPHGLRPAVRERGIEARAPASRVGEVDLRGVEATDVLDGPQEPGVGLEGDGLGVGGVIVEAQVHADVGRRERLALAVGQGEQEAVGSARQLGRGEDRQHGRPVRRR